jgi:hypothetical protein
MKTLNTSDIRFYLTPVARFGDALALSACSDLESEGQPARAPQCLNAQANAPDTLKRGRSL